MPPVFFFFSFFFNVDESIIEKKQIKGVSVMWTKKRNVRERE